MHRTISIEQRDSANADVAATLMKTKSQDGKNYYQNQLANASTAALSSLTYQTSDAGSTLNLLKKIPSKEQLVSFAPKFVKNLISDDIGNLNENYAMMAEEQAVMDRCEFLNNGCSDYSTDISLVRASPTVSTLVKDTYADWVKNHEVAVQESEAGAVPPVPTNNEFGPLIISKVHFDNDLVEYRTGKSTELNRLYGIEEDRQGRLVNLSGTSGFRSQLGEFEKKAQEADLKLVLEEMNICSRFEVLNCGCSYGGVDQLNAI